MVDKQQKGVDLGSLDTVAACNKGTEIQLLHPVSNEPLGIFITLLGSDSTAFSDRVRKNANARVKKAEQMRRRGKEMDFFSAETVEQDQIDAAVVCTTGWRDASVGKNVLIMDGKELEFNPITAEKVYTKFPWMRKQAEIAIGDLENFMKG